MKALIKDIRKNKVLYLLALPGVACLLIFNYLPMFGLVLAFKDFNYSKGFWKSDWIGLKNFEYLFKGDAFIITRNTVLYNLTFIIVGTIVAISLAIAFSELRNKRAGRLYQSLILVPYFLSWVVISYMAYGLLSKNNGLVNHLIVSFGGEKINWYYEADKWPVILIMANTWKRAGYQSIIYFAAIMGISRDYYEAAMIDGASKFKQIFYITLPMLKPVIIVLTLLAIGKMFYSDFGLFYQVPRNSGLLYRTTSVIDTYVYNGLRVMGDIGMSAAAGFYQSIVGFILVLLANKTIKMIDSEQAMF